MKSLLLALFFAIFTLSVEAQQFMKVSPDLIITEDNQRCFLVRPGYSRSDTVKWEPYCGKFVNFFYEQGYEYTLRVDKYDPQARIIKVIKIIGRDNSESYRKQLALKERKAQNEARRAQSEERARIRERVQSEVQAQVLLQMENHAQILSLTQFQIPEDYDEYEYGEDEEEYYNYDEDYVQERY